VSVLLAVSALFLISRTAVAQIPPVEVAASYARVDDHGYGYPVGWSVSAAGRVFSWLQLIGEVAGSYDFERVPDLPGFTYRNQPYTVTIYTFAAGPRFVARPSPRVTAFGEVLFGKIRFASIPDRPFGWSHALWLVQPGGGVTVRLWHRVGARGTVEIPVARGDENVAFFDAASEDFSSYGYHRFVRLGAGIVFNLGSY
jgi:hypothetical protein